MVEARGEFPLTCPQETEAKYADLSNYDLAQLTVISVDSRDVIDEIVYVGKAVMKEMYLGDV